MKKKEVRFTIDIPELDHKRLKSLSAIHGKTMKELVMQSIRIQLNQLESETKNDNSSVFSFLKDKISILDVIKEYVDIEPVKKSIYLRGACPFNECKQHLNMQKNFIVNPLKNIYYCDSCKQGGDLISFVSRIENTSPLEAIKKIHSKFKINSEDFEKMYTDLIRIDL